MDARATLASPPLATTAPEPPAAIILAAAPAEPALAPLELGLQLIVANCHGEAGS